MTTELLERPTQTDNSRDDLTHYICGGCYPEDNPIRPIALCGMTMEGKELLFGTEATCVVCRGVSFCPVCKGRLV